MEEAIGIAGMALILFAFVMNEMKKWSPDSVWYDGANALGGGLLTLYSYFIQSIPFLVLNAVWMLVALRDLLAYSRAHHPGKRKRRA